MGHDAVRQEPPRAGRTVVAPPKPNIPRGTSSSSPKGTILHPWWCECLQATEHEDTGRPRIPLDRSDEEGAGLLLVIKIAEGLATR